MPGTRAIPTTFVLAWASLKTSKLIIKSAIFEFLYKPNVSSKIIIKEYLNASNYFIDLSQTKYLNALLDKISNKIRA